MMRARFASFFTLLLGLLLLLPLQSFGQAVYGSIFGTVTDPSGAVIPNAKVTVTDVRKGTSETYTTNESGNYSATHLIPDLYKIKIEAQGFSTAESDNIQVSADTGSKFDAALKTGAQTETVQVTAEAPQLKTDRADVAIEFNEKYVEDLPNFNRNFTSLELVSPGTQKLVGWSHAATENPQGSQQIFVQGQHFSGTAYELDGTDNQDPILGIIVVNPNLDAVTETKFALQNYDAEFGKAIAGVVTAQTKSGSNEFHGTGFWFRHTDANEARDPFTQYKPDPITGKFIPSSKYNQFGGTVGGPIIKDKLFFFGDYQGVRQTNGLSQQLTIPTTQVTSTCNPANTTGAFAGYCVLQQYGPTSAGGNALIPGNGLIYDPSTGNQVTGAGRTPFCGPAGCATQPDWIPIGRLSSQALNILKLFPAPTNSNLTNNFVGAGSGPFHQNSFDTRLDYNASSSVQVFGRFSLDYFSLSGKGALGALGGVGFGQLGLAGSSITHNYSLASGLTKTFSSTLLADFRFGYFKYNPQTHKPDEGTNPATTFGIPGLNTGSVLTSGLPAFFMDSQFSNFGDDLNINRCNCPLTESEQQFQWVGNVTKIVGNHQYKFGADIRWAENLRVPSDQNRAGELNFSKQTTSLAGTGGLDFATFLLGDVSSLNRYVSTTSSAAERQKRWFFYVQDTWRVTPKLTLNYGIRAEDYFPESVNGKGNAGFANIVDGVIRVAGYGPYGLNGNIDNSPAFAPRLGVSYQLSPKMVVRMGYGRSYDMGVFGSNFGHAVTQNLPVLVSQSVTASNICSQEPAGTPCAISTNSSNNVIPAFTLAQGPPAFPFPAIPASGTFPLQGPQNNISPKIRPTYQRLPTLDAWNVTVQRQITNTMSLELAYVGNKGSHTFVGNAQTYDVNQPSIVGFAQGVPEAQRRPFYNHFIYPGYTDPSNPTQPLMCCSNGLGTYYGNDGSTHYNAFEAKLEKRFSGGLQFFTHYTFAHATNFDNNYYVDDPHIAFGPDDMNRNNVWVGSIVYELPVGRGKTYAGGMPKAADYLIGGWQISNVTNWSSGLPWTATYGECSAIEGPDINVCRPNQKGSFNVGAGSFDPINHVVTYFTPQAAFTGASSGAFSEPSLGTFGNVARNTFHGPRIFTDDMAIFKNVKITERVSGQFRVDAFNVFNHPVLAFGATQSGGTCIDCGGTNGKITDIEADTQMRQLQFSVRFSF